MSTVSKARQHHKAMTEAAAAAHEAALARHREHRKQMKAEQEKRQAQLIADIVHQNEASAAGQ